MHAVASMVLVIALWMPGCIGSENSKRIINGGNAHLQKLLKKYWGGQQLKKIDRTECQQFLNATLSIPLHYISLRYIPLYELEHFSNNIRSMVLSYPKYYKEQLMTVAHNIPFCNRIRDERHEGIDYSEETARHSFTMLSCFK